MTVPKLADSASPPAQLVKVWRFIRWLDGARWQGGGYGAIPGPVFAGLKPEAKILTHWLCYVTDQQRPYEEVWEQGGPIFAEIVNRYTATSQDAFTVLQAHTIATLKRGGVDGFSSKDQTTEGEAIGFRPRFGMHLVSIAATLEILSRHGRSLPKYIAAHWPLCEQDPRSDGMEIIRRVAFLLYLLSYADVKRGLTSVTSHAFRRFVLSRARRTEKLLADPKRFDEEYSYWLSHDDRYHKRLWAALRDYVKPGSPFKEWLLATLESMGRSDIAGSMRRHEDAIVRGLEVPGDVWNLRFFKHLFGDSVDPASFRGWYEGMRPSGALPEGAYVEQFDVSFDYSPYMCEERGFATCIFRRESRIRELCPPHNHVQWEGKLCPVAAYLCGYEYPCKPSGCPVREQEPDDLCPGCELTVSLKRAGGST